MNNNHFALLRYLLDQGYDAELLLLESEQQQFQPDKDTFQPVDFPIVHTRFSYLPSRFWQINAQQIRFYLLKYDFLIGCGPAPALCSKADLNLNIFIPYGSDIYNKPFSSFELSYSLKKIIKRVHMSSHQRRGIKSCQSIIMDYTNPYYEALFKNLDIMGKRYISNPPFLYIGEFSPRTIDKVYAVSKLYHKFRLIRSKNDIVVFHHSRHIWLDCEQVVLRKSKGTKGNQKLLIAFSNVVKRHHDKLFHLILFEYGEDVERSKHLIKELDIEKNVTWFPLSPRKEILVGISLCDIGVGELDSSYFSYGAIYEFLAMAKPVIHYRDDDQYKAFHKTMYPMYSANTTEQVEVYLEQLAENKEVFEETGRKAHEWFVKYAIERPLNFIIGQIENIGANI